MLVSGIIARAAGGQLKTLASPAAFPVPFNGGSPTTSALQELLISVGAVTSPAYNGGFVYNGTDGAIGIDLAAPISKYNGGLPQAASGLLCASYDQPIVSYVAGIPLDAAGRVALATPGGVVNLSPFDSGYDTGFQGVFP